MTDEQGETLYRLKMSIETPLNGRSTIIADKEDLETVLNMIKENSAEIQQKNTELAEKNAEIDLMAEEIEKGDIEFTEYCNFKIVCDRNCKECIERYFKRKATNNG